METIIPKDYIPMEAIIPKDYIPMEAIILMKNILQFQKHHEERQMSRSAILFEEIFQNQVRIMNHTLKSVIMY